MPLSELLCKRIISLKLRELLDCVIEGPNPALVLPAFQRNVVWTPKKMVDVWDSVLRDMPIGGFLVYPMKNKELARACGSGPQQATAGESRTRYGLFDGQQRLTALMEGWPLAKASANLCLWIDLGASENDSFAFRITTVGRPFGWDKANAANLSEDQRRKARAGYLAWAGVAEPKDDEAGFISDLSFFGIDCIEKTFLPADWPVDKRKRPTPWGATRWTIPLSELTGALLNPHENVTLDSLSDAIDCRYRGKDNTDDEEIRKKAEDALCRFRKVFADRLSDYVVGIQRVPDSLFPQTNMTTPGSDVASKLSADEPLLTLFSRIGQSGVSLSPGDLVFSMIKQVHPHTYNVVSEIWNGDDADKQRDVVPVGALLDQTDIVLLALRVARALAEAESSIPTENLSVGKPDPAAVRKMFSIGSVTGSDEKAQRVSADAKKRFCELVPEKEGSGLSIATVLRSLVNILSYRKDDVGHTGLPRPCLAFLDFDLLSVLATWVVKTFDEANQEQLESELKGSREEMLRFVLWWRLAVDNKSAAAASEAAIRCLLRGSASGAVGRDIKNTKLPGGALYRHLIELFANGREVLALTAPDELPFSPKFLAKRGQERCTPLLRGETQRFGDLDAILGEVAAANAKIGDGVPAWREQLCVHHRETAKRFWKAVTERTDILIWLQRAYVSDKFSGYDPLSLRGDEKPYDLDHINPKSSVESWGEAKFKSVTKLGNEPISNAFRDYRWLLTNSIGNYRVLELGRNRSDGNAPIRQKLFFSDGRPRSKEWADSVMSENDADLWSAASGEGTNWPRSRIEAFQLAVEARAVNLYTRMWDDLKFKEWHNAISEEHASPHPAT